MCRQSKELHPIKDEERIKLQAHLRKMYKDIEAVCTDNGIPVMLSYGSILGAIRHHGFIPWDDDLDLFMLRDDYNRFIRTCSKQLPSNYVIYAPESPNGPTINFCKIFDQNTEYKTDGTDGDSKHSGVFVDIFPLENIGLNTTSNTIRKWCSMGLSYIASSVLQYETNSTLYKKIMSGCLESKFNYYFRRGLGFLMSFMNSKKWMTIVNSFNQYKKDTGYVHCPSGGYQWIPMPKDWFEPIAVDFDDIQAFIPKESVKWLEMEYGDWQRIPPENERWEHFIQNLRL